MINHFLVNILFQLGVHIGNSKNKSLSTSNFFILGNRNSVDIISINKSIFSLQKSLFFLRELGRVNGNLLIHYTSLHTYHLYVKLFCINLIVNKANQSFFDEKWAFGQLSNFRIHAHKMVMSLFSFNIISDSDRIFKVENKKLKNRRFIKNLKSDNMSILYNLRFLDLLLRILFTTYLKYMNGINWDLHFHVMRKYWRFVLFFKFFKSFSQMPDVFILANANNYHAPLLESSRLQMPIISFLDTDTNPYLITYPIYTNDDSVILILFYMQLFVNSFLLGKTETSFSFS